MTEPQVTPSHRDGCSCGTAHYCQSEVDRLAAALSEAQAERDAGPLDLDWIEADVNDRAPAGDVVDRGHVRTLIAECRRLSAALSEARAERDRLETRMDVVLRNTDDLVEAGDNPHSKLDRIIELWRDTEDELEAETRSLQTTAAAWGRNVRHSDEQRDRANRAEARVAELEAELAVINRYDYAKDDMDALVALDAEFESAKAERDDLRAKLARVEALHQQAPDWGELTGPWCRADGKPWPCATIRAALGEDTDDAR